MGTAQLYAQLPAKMIRRQYRGALTRMNISTPDLRKLLNSSLETRLKNQLYPFLLYRRQESRRRRHGHR